MTDRIVSTPSPYALPEGYSTVPTQAQIAAEFGGDSAAQLAAMVFLFSRERSRDSAERRDQIEGQIQQYENTQVHQMHKNADSMYAANTWRALGQAANGVLGLVGANLSAEKESAGAGSAFAAAGGLLQGAAGIPAAGYQHSADKQAAKAERAGNQAASHERSLESVTSDAEDAKSMKQAVLDFLQAIQETRAESDKALVSVRA
jgi:hypothetical protein